MDQKKLRVFSFFLFTFLIIILSLRFMNILSSFGWQLAHGLYIGLFALLLYIIFTRQKRK